MDLDQDVYPTRLKTRHPPFERLDPVVYRSDRGAAPGPLSPTELAQFERNGFLFFKGFFPPAEVAPFLADLSEYNQDAGLKRLEQTITEPYSEEVRSIFAIHKLSPRFDQLTRDPRLLDIAQQLLNSDVYVHQSRINYKPGFCGAGFNWHSDFETWHSEDGMPRMRCVSLSILLTDNNPFNGPLMLIPESHRWFIPTLGKTPPENWKQSLKNQTLGVPQQDDLHRMANQGSLVAPTGPAGSLVLFECNTLHASVSNLSPWPRSNLFFVFNSLHNRLQRPYCGNQPRPEFIATRRGVARAEPGRFAALAPTYKPTWQSRTPVPQRPARNARTRLQRL